MANLLEVSDLRKVYEGPDGGVEPLQGVTFSVSRGDFVAVRGPSGCGKSTLLHILGAMERPTGGSVRFDGQELRSLHSDGLGACGGGRSGLSSRSSTCFPR